MKECCEKFLADPKNKADAMGVRVCTCGKRHFGLIAEGAQYNLKAHNAALGPKQKIPLTVQRLHEALPQAPGNFVIFVPKVGGGLEIATEAVIAQLNAPNGDLVRGMVIRRES